MTSSSTAHTIELPYGNEKLYAAVPSAQVLGSLDVADIPACTPLDDVFRDALANPIGQDRGILDAIRPSDTVTIVVSDAFRKTGVHLLLPVLLDELNGRGVGDARISFLFATGSHRPPRPDEQAAILGDCVYRRFERQAHVHDPFDDANLVEVGTTSRGTRVRINRRAIETDRLIVTGAVTLHYFGGFGGGRKSLVPGLAAIDTIAANHARNLHPSEDRLEPAVRIAAMQGNPVAEDMLEAAQFVPIHAIINTLLNGRGEIARIFAGDLHAAHAAAAKAAYDTFAVPIAEKADIVIAASAHTKNFVQTHKALFNAHQAMRDGGRIILAAPCPEGLGGEQFTKWLRLGSPHAIIAGLRQHAEINGQTALSTLQKTPHTIMVTGLTDEEVHALGARKARTLQAAVDQALAHAHARGITNPTLYTIPSAAYTVPMPR